MKKSIFIRGLAAFVACALVLPLVGSSKNPVERPLKMSGIVLENTGSSMEVVGTATHLGKFASQAYWEYDVTIGALHVWASFTAANGDLLEAEFPVWEFDPVAGVAADSGVATITGGTGRFAHASGSYVATFSGDNLEIFTVEGTIAY